MPLFIYRRYICYDIEEIKQGQPIATSGVRYIITGTNETNQNVLINGKVINDVRGAEELRKYASENIRTELDQKVIELITVASQNNNYSELNKRLQNVLKEYKIGALLSQEKKQSEPIPAESKKPNRS